MFLGIEHYPEALIYLNKFPLWRSVDDYSQFYLSTLLLNTMEKHKLTGIERYSSHERQGEETICPLFLLD